MSAGVKLKDQVYEKILDEITEGKYQQNDIITERELIEKYGVSKSPVREALIELCKEDVLESRPRMGYQIRPISIKEISDIVELRIILETAALKKTFQHLEPEHIELLKKNLNDAARIHSEKNITKHWKCNISFHLLLCSFCGNSKIYSEVERALQFSFRGAIQYFSLSWNRSHSTEAQRHHKLIVTMENRDLEKSLEILIEDIEDLKYELMAEINS